MGEADLELVLGLVARLSVEQRERLRAALAAGDGEAAIVPILEARLGAAPVCVHCGSEALQRWGKSHGLRRWRCRACARSFNALTGTPLARLRKKAVWLVFAKTLAEGLTVAAAAERCGVHATTSFRWRHRFLRAKVADQEGLCGIVEADETYFRLSFKGSRRWLQADAPAGRGAKRRGTKAPTRGLSVEQVPVVVARDRAGATRAVVLPDRSAEALDAAIGAALPTDGILCSDAEPAMAKVAALRGVRHEPVNLAKGERVRDKTWHIQNANAHHSRLKRWVRSFNGVATRYLPNYLAWHHSLERNSKMADPKLWIQTALNS
jgi:transposase-like protein